jgi:hypothetical protein
MEALNGLFRHADQSGLFLPLCGPAIKYRLSLYADDLVIFLRPKDIRLTQAILEFFAGVSGLHTNLSKSPFTPIRCTEEHIALVMQWFPYQLVHFPCRYLGVPLSIYKLKRGDLMPLVEAITDRLPTWKSSFMSRVSRTMLTKVTLIAILIHVSVVVEVSSWIYKEIDKLRRAFVWTGLDMANGGQCEVTWSQVARPQELGGLGVLDLTMISYVLRLCWSWLVRIDPVAGRCCLCRRKDWYAPCLRPLPLSTLATAGAPCSGATDGLMAAPFRAWRLIYATQCALGLVQGG